jgi:hypothetical protein
VIRPATGGVFLNSVMQRQTNELKQVRFTDAHGVTLATGDLVFSSTTNATIIGAATLRLASEAVNSAPNGVPVSVTLDGTSAGSLNNVTVKY